MTYSESELLIAIVNAIQNKKGIDIVDLNLSKLEHSITDHFVICHGNSNIQVEAIASSVEDEVKNILNINAIHKEGQRSAQWILLNYEGIVVHVFQKEYREHYNLEGLWADAEIKHIANE